MQGLEWRTYPTHRVAFYKDWLILDALDGYFLTYRPNDDFEMECIISDYEYMTECCDCEWDAGSLAEAIDFIDDYYR